MPLLPPEREQRPQAPAGTHAAIITQVIHVGTQVFDYQGKTNVVPTVQLTFELPNETAVFKEGDIERPFIVSKDFRLSYWETASLGIGLRALLGVDTIDEKTFDLFQIVGKPCTVVTYLDAGKKNPSGPKYAKVESFSAPMKGVTTPARVNPLVTYSVNEHDENVFESLYPLTKKSIQKSSEWIKKYGVTVNDSKGKDGASPDDLQPPANDDDLPF